ncbi:hypothetical protein E6C76_13985 [Pseudothauera nasutitermitis]|uniref:Uncharacterized protein n=1 Tax=Pseudothauera nasutitermitis TaxID=2565930 RepID=A0A4S4AV45_9RHOO|nr:hypothetical protein [Pseudothauera nasutitermitis]THF63694.1 hypothetical protein E6C76_13985 [Pseudothauera nasutitermitis]
MSNSGRDDAPQPYTLRGRALDAELPAPSRKQGNPLGEAIMERRRSNSIRRLPVATLMTLPTIHPNSKIAEAAIRELGVRQDIVQASKHQFLKMERPDMNAKGPVGMREASAIRFAASMAEEAQDEVVREDIKRGQKPKQVGQIGLASVDGHMGIGFSGKSSEMAHTQRVQDRMLALQEHYDQKGRADHWSGRLQGIAVSDVVAESNANVCAAKRAAHVAHSMSLGDQAPTEPVKRHRVPPPDTLVEMMSPSMSGRGNLLSDFSVQSSSQHPDPAPQGTRTIGNRTRRDSVSSMANSCETCMKEHMEHMNKRGR